MNVVSLFDGMSCGQIALNKLGIKYDNYYASEIDTSAISITMKNYPNTIQVGDVTKFDTSNLPKIDLLIGGSPCQGFSKEGKQLNFKDPRSVLFFEFVRILKEVKPKYFLLENVKMNKDSQKIISDYLGVKPILINSNLVSCQNRPRLYWTNIPNISQPKDKQIKFTDVIERNVDDKYYYDNSQLNVDFVERNKNEVDTFFFERRTAEGKRLRVTHKLKTGKDSTPRVAKRLIPRTDNKANCLTANFSKKEHVIIDRKGFRKTTPTEWEIFQNVPKDYTDGVSDNQRYKMLGNGWTIDVIAHILKNMGEHSKYKLW